jgi:hypothetical protein
MKSRTSARRLRLPAPEPDGVAEEQIEFVLEDEEGESWGESSEISAVRAFPALQEYLRDIYDPDAHAGRFRRH